MCLDQAALSLKEVKVPNASQNYWQNIEKWILLVSWIVSILLDPIMCYGLSIHDEEKLLKINKPSIIVPIWCLNCILHIYRIISFSKYPKEWQFSKLIIEPITLLFSNVLVYPAVLIPKIGITAPVFFLVLALLLLVYLARIIIIYRLVTEVATTSSKLVHPEVVKIVLNLLLFLYGGHLFGGLWYLLAVWKKVSCWKNACLNHSGCHYANHRFNVSSGDDKFINDICFPKTEYTQTYELGIFKDALESHIVEMATGFWRKLFYCFRWGVQNISGFGQNLQVSTYTWENIFVILIAIYGVGTFTLFIGNMQVGINIILFLVSHCLFCKVKRKHLVLLSMDYVFFVKQNLLKSVIDKTLEEKRQKEEQDNKQKQQQLQQWSPFGNLSENLQNYIIMEYQKYSCKQTGGFDVENLFNNIPEDVQNNIKSKLYSELLKKVERFRGWSNTSLLHLCYCIKPVVYAKGDRIVHAGHPIDGMLIVLKGKLCTFSCSGISTTRKDLLKDGDCWGEELVNWVQDESSSSNKLISHATIRALTKVEAFVLRIDDLNILYNQNAKILQSWFRKWIQNAKTSTQKQTQPGDDQLTEIVIEDD